MKRKIWSDEYLTLRVALKKMRKKAGLTQEELAFLLDKPRTFVTKYEIADRNLDFIEVINVCIACKINPEKFLKNLLKEL